MGCHTSSAQREVHSNTGLLKKEEKSQINNLTHHLNELEKEEQTKPKVSRRKEIIKIKEEINKIEIKKIEKNLEIYRCCFNCNRWCIYVGLDLRR